MKKISDEEIMSELKRVYKLTGNVPKPKKWRIASKLSIDVLVRAFGSYKNAWKHIGIDYNTKSESHKKDEMLVALKKAFIEDKTARTDDIIRKSGHTRSTITKYFGSVFSAFSAAKIVLGRVISVEDLISEFIRVSNQLGRIPSEKDIDQYSKYASSTFRRRIGSLDCVVKSAGLQMDTKLKETPEELLVELKRICVDLGRAPTTIEISGLSKFSHMVYRRVFGSYNKALERVGYEPNINMKIEQKCSVCGHTTTNMISHLSKQHPDELKRQEELVVELYKSGLSTREIAIRDDIVFNGGTSINRVIDKYLTCEEKEELRRNKIKRKLQTDYASGKYDWVSVLNRTRNMTEEAKRKNSDGLKLSYKNGIKKSWNKGLTKENSLVIESAANKTSDTLKERFVSGETEYKIGPEVNNWNNNREEVANRYRLGLGFSAEERRSIKKRAEYKCEKCGVSQELLEEQNEILECDHIIPIFKGGLKDWENNGQALCPKCHKEKTRNDCVELIKSNP